MALKCLSCESENLRGHVTLEFQVPLSTRPGGIKLGGMKVSALDIRAAWEAQKMRRIECLECRTKHVFEPEGVPTFRRVGSWDLAVSSESEELDGSTG